MSLKVGYTRPRTLYPYAHVIRRRKLASRRGGLQPIRGHEWWAEQARQYDGRECGKCSGLTRGEYTAPHDTLGECGVIERCQLCGWERVHISGRHGRPI